MADPAPPAVCSTTDYQYFHPLAGFPPAQGWCSTVSLLAKRSEKDGANALALRDVQCPTGSSLCALLAELRAADREFARGACCCIGVCVGDEPTAIITIPETTTPTSTPSTSQSSSSMTYNQRHSSDSLLPASTSSSSSESLTWIQRHSSDSLEPMPSSLIDPHPSSLILTTSSSSSLSTSTSIFSSGTSSGILPTSSSTSSSSSLSSSALSSSSLSSSSLSSSSSSTSASTPTCTSVAGGPATFNLYYSGSGYVENTNNPGNNIPANYPPEYSTISGTVAMCAAASTCATTTYNYPANYYSFDLHLVMSNSTWECVSYLNQNSGTGAASYFNVANADVGGAYGYSL